MSKEVRTKFIELCSKEDIIDWVEERVFDTKILKELKIGKCTLDVFTTLNELFGSEKLKSAGFYDKNNRSKYHNRIIIPSGTDYFSARSNLNNKYKNLFPKGLKKRIYFIQGKINEDCYLVEGETDAIRIKHEYPNSNIISIGGSKGKEILNDVVKKTIEVNAKRIIFCYDNDESGKEALKNNINFLSQHRLRAEYENKIYKCKFKEIYKDIDEYFKDGGLAKDLLFEKIELDSKKQFHKNSIYNKIILPIDNYLDNAKRFYQHQPFFYDKSGMFWFWNKHLSKYEFVDDVDVMSKFDKVLGFMGQTISSKIKSNTLEGMKRVGRDMIPMEAKKKWIQFKDKAYSIYSGKLHTVTPDYLFTNPIPWEIGYSDETPTIDKLFNEWVGIEYKDTLYEIIAYCCLSDYPIHLIFCLIGCGRNGKSKFIGLLNKFIGQENVCSTELDTLLDSRFESFKLYRKLVCCLGETNFGILNKTSLLKKLCGQDLIGFEYKQKVPFDEYNYAKIVISSNSLPTSEDTSEGFYRRWLIIDFPNIFPEGKDILKNIPVVEYNNLAKKVINILPKLLEKGEFSNQGDIEERRDRYILSSNPLPKFITLTCKKKGDLFVKYSELYTAYATFLGKNRRRVVSKREFGAALVGEGYEISHTSKKINDVWTTDNYILGLELLPKWESFVHFVHFNPKISTLFTRGGKSTENRVEMNEMNENLEMEDETETIEEIIYDKTLEDFEKFIDLNPKDNYDLSKDTFGMDIIKRWLREGLIFEPKKGTLSLLK